MPMDKFKCGAWRVKSAQHSEAPQAGIPGSRNVCWIKKLCLVTQVSVACQSRRSLCLDALARELRSDLDFFLRSVDVLNTWLNAACPGAIRSETKIEK